MKYLIVGIALSGMLVGCASVPNGPSVAVMPAPGKPFDLFAAEDRECRQYAEQSIGKPVNEAATDSELKSIAVGTAIGVAAGVLGSDSSRGAGPGAAAGMVTGTMAGANEANYSARESQRRYDIAYEQCMYAKGNQLPQSSLYRPQTNYSQPPASPPPPVR